MRNCGPTFQKLYTDASGNLRCTIDTNLIVGIVNNNQEDSPEAEPIRDWLKGKAPLGDQEHSEIRERINDLLEEGKILGH